MNLTSEIVGQKNVYPFLNSVYELHSTISNHKVRSLINNYKLHEFIYEDLVRCGIFNHTAKSIYLSSLGEKIILFLRGINEADTLSEIIHKLNNLTVHSRKYELITDNITGYLINRLYQNPNFIRLYICSPWIKLDNQYISKLKSAYFEASKKYSNIQIKIVTLPPDGYHNWRASENTFNELRSMGAEILHHKHKKDNIYKLHTKLYIAEPGPNGGEHFAILGSENLTGRGNTELAIKVENDNSILFNLTEYFNTIYYQAE
jgi:hypothetical protein